MKILLISLIFAASNYAQQHEAPTQLAGWKSCVNTQTCLKAIADPVCVSTGLIAYVTYNVCNLPYPYACAAGAAISCTCLACAMKANETQYNYYSVNTLAAIKRGFLTVFPCMQEAVSVTKKTE
ncbi:hypothetical protein BH09DEP1_BH09DEP1_1820 [soil metagenome]